LERDGVWRETEEDTEQYKQQSSVAIWEEEAE